MRNDILPFTSNDSRPFLHAHYRHFSGSTSTFQQQLGGLLLFVHRQPCGCLLPFLVPITLSLHIPLGACFEPDSLAAPVTLHGFSSIQFLLIHAAVRSIGRDAFLRLRRIDPYIRRFVSSLEHSHLGYFIDSRPMGDTSHLWDAFVLLGHGHSRPTSPGF